MITRDWSQVQKSAHLKKCTQGVRNKGSLTGIFFFLLSFFSFAKLSAELNAFATVY